MKQYFTANEYKELLKRMCVVGTTNEKKNEHIVDFFKSKDILFESRSLKTGDYCFKLVGGFDGKSADIYFTDEIFIERKNSLSELAASINNEAFHYELKRAQNIPHKFLIIEEDYGISDVLDPNKYRSEYNERAFWSTLHTFETKYDLHINFCKNPIWAWKYILCVRRF